MPRCRPSPSRVRRRQGLARPREGAMVLGLAALLLVFVVTLPFVAGRVALAVQFQVSRIFWMLDFIAVIYAVWALADAGRTRAGAAPRRPARGSRGVRLVCLAAARGGWVTWIEHPGRPVMQAALPHGRLAGRHGLVAATAGGDPRAGRPVPCMARGLQRARGRRTRRVPRGGQGRGDGDVLAPCRDARVGAQRAPWATSTPSRRRRRARWPIASASTCSSPSARSTCRSPTATRASRSTGCGPDLFLCRPRRWRVRERPTAPDRSCTATDRSRRASSSRGTRP